MDYLQIIFIIFIALHSSIVAINIYKSNQISVFKSDKIIVITNSIISLLPICTYTIYLISYSADNTTITKIMPFFIEWLIVIPLLLINMSRFININLCKKSIIIVLSTALIIIGYASAINDDVSISTVLFIVSSLIYIKLLAFLYILYYYEYKEIRNCDVNLNALAHNNLSLFKCLGLFISITWNGYPIALILWKYNAISIDAMIAIFVILGFITKGISVLLILYYNMYINGNNNRFVRIFKKVVKVYPISDIENRLRLENEIAPKSILKKGTGGEYIISTSVDV